MWLMANQAQQGPQTTLQAAPQPQATSATRQAIVNALAGMQNSDYSPVSSPFQGLARVTGDVMNGMAQRRYNLQHTFPNAPGSSGTVPGIPGITS